MGGSKDNSELFVSLGVRTRTQKLRLSEVFSDMGQEEDLRTHPETR